MLAVLLAAAVGCAGDDATGITPTPTPDANITVKNGIEGVETLTAADGWTIKVPRFEVPAGTEITDCYFMRVPDLNGDGSDVWIEKFKVGQRPGSHHMNIFRVNTVINLFGEDGEVIHDGECKNLPNWADWPLVVNSQESDPQKPAFEWQLPDHVAQRFQVGQMLMLQTHYVNATHQASPEGGEVKVNFYKSKDADTIELGTLFGTAKQIRVCRSNPNPTFDARCVIDSDHEVHIAAANGHFHSRGMQVDMFAFDGVTIARPGDDQRFYRSKVWSDPPMMTGSDVVIPPGGGVWWSCEFEWSEPVAGCEAIDARDPSPEKDCCYVFGNTAELAEHCNVFAYYWPRVDDGAIHCLPKVPVPGLPPAEE